MAQEKLNDTLEILQQQLTLLSEASEKCDDCLLADLTLAMCRVVELLKEIPPAL